MSTEDSNKEFEHEMKKAYTSALLDLTDHATKHRLLGSLVEALTKTLAKIIILQSPGARNHLMRVTLVLAEAYERDFRAHNSQETCANLDSLHAKVDESIVKGSKEFDKAISKIAKS